MSKFYTIIHSFVLILFIALLSHVGSVYAQEEFVPDQLIIKLKEGTNSINVAERFGRDGMAIVESIPELGLYVIKIPPEELEDMEYFLSLDPNFEYAVKNDILYATTTPNDEFFNLQTYLNVIDAPMAWDTETGDPDVVLAILDTGVEATHQDLSGKVLPGCSTLEGFDENTCGTDTNDFNGHGSGVSGTAAAITNNIDGVAGVCWNCSILPVKVLNDNGSGSTVDVIQGILFARNYALNNPTRKVIINMSLGRSCEPPTFVPLSQAMQDAINLAWNSGLVIVAAAGNDGNSLLHCPASAANTIAVSATDNNDNLAGFSSFGNFVDLAAPGVGIANVISSLVSPPTLYVFWSGTSFSSPIVAGVVGLVWSANMSLTNGQVDQILRDSADNIGDPFFFGDGRVNANAAVLAAGGPPTPTPTPPPTASDSVLTALDPGIAGGTSTLTVMGVPAGETVKFKYSFNTGISAISGGVCNGRTLDLNNQTNLGTATADGTGTATINVSISSNASGVTIHMQAYTETGSSCGISNRITQTIQ